MSELERFAEAQHNIWSSWMKWMFTDGGSFCGRSWTMHPDKVLRWARQANTPYAELPEDEKQSDRDVVKEHMPWLIEAINEHESLGRVYDQAKSALAASERENAELRAEIERMKLVTYCAYCGEEFPVDGASELVSDHINTCPKHPIAEYRAEIKRLCSVIDNLSIGMEKAENEIKKWQGLSKELGLRQTSMAQRATRTPLGGCTCESLAVAESDLARLRERIDMAHEAITRHNCPCCRNAGEILMGAQDEPKDG